MSDMPDQAAITAICFATFGKLGTYTPVAGSQTAASFIDASPDSLIGLGSAGGIVADVTADVQVSEWATPARGDAVTLYNGESYRVATYKRDTTGTRWHLGLDKA